MVRPPEGLHRPGEQRVALRNSHPARLQHTRGTVTASLLSGDTTIATATLGVSVTEPNEYDVNGDGCIKLKELTAATLDYRDGRLSFDDFSEVYMLYSPS